MKLSDKAEAANHNLVENEAELQARLEPKIRAAFPLLPAKIKLEHHLHLRLGHHRIIIDGALSDKGSTCGRYDVLVLVEDKPLLLAELKAPDVVIDEDDVRQALSYARLLDPIVPLVLVTNGVNTIIRRTYDGKDIEVASDENLSAILNTASTLAASASEDAIRTLLGGSTDTWRQLFAKWNEETIAGLTGSVRDFRYPITNEFCIEREAVSQLLKPLFEGAKVIVLHGPPLSGVTNVLVQLARHEYRNPTIFIDAHSAADLLQFIATRMTREMYFGISKEDVRTWLNTCGDLSNILLIMDGSPKDGINELIDFANAGLFQLVIGMGSESFRQSAVIPGRAQRTLLGRSSIEIELFPLSESEFNLAFGIFAAKFGAHFFNGAQHVQELRWPRRLRIIAATLPDLSNRPPELGSAVRLMLPPIPGPMILEQCSQAFGNDPKLKYDLQKVADSYLSDAEQHIGNSDWFMATWGRPCINPETLYQNLGEQGVERLCESGLLSWTDTPSIGQRFLVRVEELLAHHVAEAWKIELVKLVDANEISRRLKELLRLADVIPTGDIALAAAIFRASQLNSSVLGAAIPYLMSQAPETTKINNGSQINILVKGDRIPLLFDVDMSEELVGGMLPWLVLSHIASWSMAVEGFKLTMNYSIFATLGSSCHFLYQPKPCDLADVQGFHFHEIEGIGSLPCIYGTGIVEPLMQSMLDHMHSFPEEMVMLSEYAMKEKEMHLAWRLLAISQVSEDSTDMDVAKASKSITEVLNGWWGSALKEALKKQGSHRGCHRQN